MLHNQTPDTLLVNNKETRNTIPDNTKYWCVNKNYENIINQKCQDTLSFTNYDLEKKFF